MVALCRACTCVVEWNVGITRISTKPGYGDWRVVRETSIKHPNGVLEWVHCPCCMSIWGLTEVSGMVRCAVLGGNTRNTPISYKNRICRCQVTRQQEG